jgi:hypothetical protein
MVRSPPLSGPLVCDERRGQVSKIGLIICLISRSKTEKWYTDVLCLSCSS